MLVRKQSTLTAVAKPDLLVTSPYHSLSSSVCTQVDAINFWQSPEYAISKQSDPKMSMFALRCLQLNESSYDESNISRIPTAISINSLFKMI